MLPVTWTEDGFPVILPRGESVPLIVRHEGVKRGDNPTFGNFKLEDDFSSPVLGDRWMTLRSPATENYSLTDVPGYLELNCSFEKATGNHTPSYVAHRLHHHKFSAETRMYFNPTKHSEAAGLLVFKDERHQYSLMVSMDAITVRKIEFGIVAGDGMRMKFEEMSKDLASVSIDKYRFIDLKVTSDAETFSFWYSINGKKWQPLLEGVDASYLTSASAGGFTGTLIGPYAVK